MSPKNLKEYILPLHDGFKMFKKDGMLFYSLEGKGIVLSMEGTDLQFYVLPEYRRQRLSTKYLRQIIRHDLGLYTTLDLSFVDSWFEEAIFRNLPHSDILTFKTLEGLYLVNARKKGEFIENPYDFKI